VQNVRIQNKNKEKEQASLFASDFGNIDLLAATVNKNDNLPRS